MDLAVGHRAAKPWSGFRSRRRWQRIVIALAIVALLACVVPLVGHYRAMHSAVALGIAAFTPYLMLAGPLALILFAVARSWVGLVLAVAVTAWFVLIQAPLVTSSAAPAGAHDVVAMTSNLRLGSANPAAVISAVRTHRVDVLMLEELTSDEQTNLASAGLDKLLPYHVSEPGFAATGTGLWSRYPLTKTTRRSDFFLAFLTAHLHLPDGREVFVAAAHMAGPWPESAAWNVDIDHLPSVLATFPTNLPVLLGGDFNATPDTAQFRALLTGGYADAAHQAGAGITATYPSDRWFPPLIAIDHVLTRDAVARSADTIEIPGSDHRSLVVTVALPGSAA